MSFIGRAYKLKLCCNHLICMSILLIFQGLQSLDAQNITPYRSLRYQQTIGQADIYTCGAAAIATLFTHFYKQPVSELDVLEIAEKVMQGSGKKPQESGLDGLSLRQALVEKRIYASVKEVSLDQLRKYFNRGGLPTVIHVTIPQSHYILAIGLVEDWLIVADPSSGRGMFPLETLNTQKGFSGIVIFTSPPDEIVEVARQQQKLSQDWADGRLQRFNAMKRSIL
jgi:uncharacterized protein